MVAEQILKGSARLRFWFAEAVHYNKVNGIQVRELQWLNDLPDQFARSWHNREQVSVAVTLR